MQNNLAVIGDSEWQVLQQQAAALVASGFLPQSINNPQKAVAIMMLGRELGIPPWAALSTINVIQGKPTVSPQLMLALINRSGQLADMECLSSADECTVTMVRRGRVPHTETFTMKDATALQLTGKDNYKKQPATMLKWRAVAACARVVFPDVILGLYTPEEMGAEVRVDNEGNMELIDVTPEPPKQLQDGAEAHQPPPTPSAQPTPASGSQTGIPASAVPNGSAPSTPASPLTGGASAKSELFPEDATVIELNTEGDAEHLPRKDGLPVLGSLNMGNLLRSAYEEKLVRGKAHFANLIDLLWRDGDIRAASTPSAVMEAIRKHEAQKDMAKEGVAGK